VRLIETAKMDASLMEYALEAVTDVASAGVKPFVSSHDKEPSV
jgi:hypothetical protein